MTCDRSGGGRLINNACNQVSSRSACRRRGTRQGPLRDQGVAGIKGPQAVIIPHAIRCRQKVERRRIYYPHTVTHGYTD